MSTCVRLLVIIWYELYERTEDVVFDTERVLRFFRFICLGSESAPSYYTVITTKMSIRVNNSTVRFPTKNRPYVYHMICFISAVIHLS